ncbi:MAG: tRNA 4-thiouridine(8) synthase ThiI [Bacilli bacterium]|nr:tRNA 4-thiouridine(8) synthase ThiI [Bacilli bacterium]
MNRVILIKYGELTTKKGNRNFFVNTLYQNIKNKLKNYDVEISKDISRMYIRFQDKDLEKIKHVIDCIFGIHMYHIAHIVDTNTDKIKTILLKILREEKFNTFKIETKRSDKTFEIPSQEMNPLLGAHILKNIDGIQVDVHHPDVLVKVEIRPYHTYIYTNGYKGCGGYPVGTQARGMLMLSGGIDSPVAGYLAMKRGIKLDAVYFEAIPHTSLDARNKVIDLTKKLVKYTDKINLHIVNFTKIQETIYKNGNPTYCITIMRRMMYRIMEKLAKIQKGLVIINGESIGQVASQTLTSMSVINQVTNMPVIRPVACLDKLEIIEIARKIGTYDISILPYEDCCTVFVPKHPVINPNLEECLKMEENVSYEKLIDEAIQEINTITIEDNDLEFENLL